MRASWHHDNPSIASEEQEKSLFLLLFSFFGPQHRYPAVLHASDEMGLGETLRRTPSPASDGDGVSKLTWDTLVAVFTLLQVQRLNA